MGYLSKRKICMNRKQRRKAGIKKKVPTYTFNQEQLYDEIKKGVEQYREGLKEEMGTQAIRVVIFMSLLILRDKWGFGKKRLRDFVFEFVEQVECLKKGYVSLEDMINVIQEETGLDIKDLVKF